jgi:hypothetical protein
MGSPIGSQALVPTSTPYNFAGKSTNGVAWNPHILRPRLPNTLVSRGENGIGTPIFPEMWSAPRGNPYM